MQGVASRTALAALIALVAIAVPAAAQSSPAMDPAAFATELQRISTVISSGAPGAVPDVRLPAVWTVETRGQRFEMPAIWLRQEIDAARLNPSAWPSKRFSLLAQLAALKIEAESLAALHASPRVPDPAVARTALTGVLARPDFRRMAQQSAMSSLRQRISQWLLRIWDRLGGKALGRRGTALVFAWIAALLALGVLTAWLVQLIMRPDRHGRLALTAPSARRRSARAWARDAMQAADPREAARCAYRAAVCRFEEDGAWRPDDTRTPREYLRLLSPDHRGRGLLADVTRRFEEIWYGAREATEDDRQSLLARLRELGCLPAE
jgi:hypothetical protein